MTCATTPFHGEAVMFNAQFMKFYAPAFTCLILLLSPACSTNSPGTRDAAVMHERDAASDSGADNNGKKDASPGDGDGDQPGGDGDQPGGDGDNPGNMDSGAGGDSDAGHPGGGGKVDDILARLKNCTPESGARFSTDSGGDEHIPICTLKGALFWKADMDIDCDGERTDHCNENTDGAYQNQTSGKAHDGKWLTADQLPYVVIPSESDFFKYTDYGIDIGTVMAVIYKGKLQYGVFGDSGPEHIIGEASYAMAQRLGINPDPDNGGTEEEAVYYIAFEGQDGMTDPLDDEQNTNNKGAELMQQLLSDNP